MNLKDNPHYMKAKAFIKSTDLNSLEPGTYVIDEGNVWVNIVEAELRSSEEALLEAHDKYIDIHIPLSGTEYYGVKDRARCTSPRGEMDAESDVLFFDDEIDNLISGEMGEKTVFLPEEAHAPLIGEGFLRKAIFKVKVI